MSQTHQPSEQKVAALLRTAFETVREQPDDAHLRTEAVAAMERAMAESSVVALPTRKRAPMYWVAAAAALVVTGTAVYSALRPGHATPPPLATEPDAVLLSANGEVTGPTVGTEWKAEAPLTTGRQGAASVRIGRSKLTLAANTALTHRGRSHIMLLQGEVLAEVVEADVLTLDTSDLMVAAHEARFWLSPTQGCGGQTRVKVVSGRLSVTQGTKTFDLSANEEWPTAADCPVVTGQSGAATVDEEEPVAPVEHPTVAQRPPAAPGKTKKPQRRGHPALAAQPQPEPQPQAFETPAIEAVDPLTKQNELYGRAVSAHHAGQTQAAVGLLNDLLQQFPSGQMAETAMLQKMRWLSDHDPGSARLTAQQYLSRFPRGIGRAEAEQLVMEAP